MPSVTFLVAIDVSEISPNALLMDAEDIHDHLDSAGLTVLSVVPWARPSNPISQPAGGFTSLTAPPPTQSTI